MIFNILKEGLKMNSKFDNLLNKAAIKTLDTVIANVSLRGYVLNIANKKVHKKLLEINQTERLYKVQENKYQILHNMLKSIDKALDNKTISKQVRIRMLESFGKNVLIKSTGANTIEKFEKIHGFEPPFFLTISPGKLCNLRCKGCYATSSKETSEKLDYNILSRIISEKKELWGSYFTVISGGEPFLYKSDGKGIIDLAKEHSDNYFLVYTNGTLINEKMAERLAEVGNITPAISVEGFEKETDERRGKGVHKRILKAFENLHKAGVPFGISVTATRDNAELVVSDEFINYYFDEQGALYDWMFQYMPIGRRYTLDLMVTPEQRLNMFKKTFELIYKRGIFIIDFWNCGTITDGCISAGREHGGYFYIDWNGNVAPCVFNPYFTHNVIDVFEKGGNLNTILFSPFFKEIRKWQCKYSYNTTAEKTGNQILPCPIRDHFKNMYSILKKYNVKPMDEQASEAFKDESYHSGLNDYDERLKTLFDPIWNNEYIYDKS